MLWTTDDLPLSLWQTRRGTPEEADALVVGGGLCGLSSAYWLRREMGDGARVVVLEAGAVAGRASGRGLGFLSTGTAEPFARLCDEIGREPALGLWERTRENRELLRRELLDPGRVDADFLPEGSWIAVLDPERATALEASCETLREEGFDCRWMPAEAVREASGADTLGGAVFQQRDGGLDPVKLCRGLAATGGFELRTGCRVREIGSVGERVRLATEAGDWLAPRVVVALGARTPVLLPHLATEIRPVRVQALATVPGERRLRGVWWLDDGDLSLRQAADGAVVLGGRRRVAAEQEVGYLEAPTARVQGALDDALAATFPHLADRPVTHRWAATRASTADGLPRVGTVPGVPGAVFAAGLHGRGLYLGFAAGRHLARRALGREDGPLIPGLS